MFFALEKQFIINNNCKFLKKIMCNNCKFTPFEYGDPYTKGTALWGEFNKPRKNIVKPRELGFGHEMILFQGLNIILT